MFLRTGHQGIQLLRQPEQYARDFVGYAGTGQRQRFGFSAQAAGEDEQGVSNAVRHGRATNIKLSNGQDEATDIVTFRLQDDGIGFDPDAVGMEDLYASGRRGLTGMRQRIESIGGTLKITSEADKGTTVEACFPGSTEDGDTETDPSA